MFSCPKCGSSEFKTLARPLPDGSFERECLGTVREKMLVPKGMNHSGLAQEDRFMHTRRCMFVWSSKDDGLYGVEDSVGQVVEDA